MKAETCGSPSGLPLFFWGFPRDALLEFDPGEHATAPLWVQGGAACHCPGGLCYKPGPLLMNSKSNPLRPLSIVLCGLPIALHVARIIIDQEASTEAMATLAVVALFGLTSLLGQRWAVKLAPAVFLLSGASLVVYSVMGIAQFYWLLVMGLAWCSYELVMSPDIQANLIERGA